MFRITVVLLLLNVSLTVSYVNENRLSKIVTIVTDVITKIISERTGIVYCWFYTAHHDPQPDDLLEMIQQQVALRNTSRLTLKQYLPIVWNGYHRMPTILVLDLRFAQTNPEWIPRLKYGVMKDVYVLIFINRSESRYLTAIQQMLKDAGLLNVFYFHTNKEENFYENCFSKSRTYIKTFPSSIFPDHVRNVHRYHLRVSQLSSTIYAMFTEDMTSIGPLIDWIDITTQLINATFGVTRVRCSNRGNCFMNMVVDDDDRTYDINIDAVRWGIPRLLCSAVRSMVPMENGLIAPRSPKMKMLELFIAPYKKEVWIIIILLLIACALLTQLFPDRFQNNLILLTLCSFERISLYRVNRLEKMVAISLVIFFFILLSAYESLFISLMTNRPRLRNPRTIEDLLEAGITLDVNEYTLDTVDERLRPLVKNVSYFKTTLLDGHAAYADGKDYMKSVMRHPKNFDYASGESRYVMLDYSSWKGFGYHMVGWDTPLLYKLRFTQSVLEESGIYQKLTDQMEHKYFRGRGHQLLVRRFQADHVMLSMYNLSPAWIVLAFGWTLSAVALVAELGWFKVCKIDFGRRMTLPVGLRRLFKGKAI